MNPLICLMLLLSACASFNRVAPGIVEPEWKSEFNKASHLYEARDFEAAHSAFEQHLARYGASPVALSAQFLAGRSLESLGRNEQAIEHFKRVLALAQDSDATQVRLKYQALYRLSYCYEATGQKDALLASLLDLQRASSYFVPVVREVELPARLASAYSRIGNMASAQLYFDQAESAFNRFQSKIKDEKEISWLAESLYRMGRAALEPVTLDLLTEQLAGAQQGQKFLLRSIEMGVEPYAAQSYELLVGTWKRLNEALAAEPDDKISEDSFALRSWRQNHTQQAKAFSELLDEASLFKLPQTGLRSQALESQLEATLKEISESVKARLFPIIPDVLLTPEALEREGKIEKVKLVDPEQPQKRRKSK